MASLENQNWIGMICRFNGIPKLAEHTYTWMFRILVLDLELMKYNTKIICYTPADVDPENKTVTGIILENTEFKKVTLPLPKINYDYHFGKTETQGKPGFSYPEFEPWALKNGYQIYPEKSLRELAKDKLAAAELLSQCVREMIPHTEPFQREQMQLMQFFQKAKTVFIKPRFGSAGNGIFVVNLENNQFLVDYYSQGQKITNSFESPDAFLATLKNDKYQEYIIQEGVPCIRYEGRVFDMRVVMFKEGKNWHCLHEIRLGAKDKKISNGSQGGEAVPSLVLLNKLFPQKSVSLILEKIRNASQKIAAYINEHLHDKVTEIALDVLIDAKENIYLAEINVKPGLCGGFTLYDNFFNMSEEDKFLFENQAKKHGEYLAKALLHRSQDVFTSAG